MLFRHNGFGGEIWADISVMPARGCESHPRTRIRRGRTLCAGRAPPRAAPGGGPMTTPQADPDGRTAALPAWVRRPANLGQAVTAELVGRIVRGVHPPGTPLPPEPALCETFSVSRTVIREAVKVLQEKGLVQVRQGSGTIVTPSTMWNMLDELVLGATIAEDETLAILDDLVVTRRVLESDMANF